MSSKIKETHIANIEILGRKFKINCPAAQQERLAQAVIDLNNHLLELKTRTQVTNIEKLVCIAALNMCYELAQEREKIANYINDIEKKVKALQEMLEKKLHPFASSQKKND